jgi:Protein of unknown function (DUF1501)
MLGNAYGAWAESSQAASPIFSLSSLAAGLPTASRMVRSNAGRDHFVIQTAVLAGAGVTGGKMIGKTSVDGSSSLNSDGTAAAQPAPATSGPKISRQPSIPPMGIDWTKVRQGDPFRRGFEYVPFASQGTYGPISTSCGPRRPTAQAYFFEPDNETAASVVSTRKTNVSCK